MRYEVKSFTGKNKHTIQFKKTHPDYFKMLTLHMYLAKLVELKKNVAGSGEHEDFCDSEDAGLGWMVFIGSRMCPSQAHHFKLQFTLWTVNLSPGTSWVLKSMAGCRSLGLQNRNHNETPSHTSQDGYY